MPQLSKADESRAATKLLLALILATFLLIGGCSVLMLAGSSKTAETTTEAASTPVPVRVECRSRKPDYGDLIVRTMVPLVSAHAQVLGDQWSWDERTQTCVTGVEFLLDATQPGECTEIGTVSDNPGFDLEEDPAPRLTDVLDSRGDC